MNDTQAQRRHMGTSGQQGETTMKHSLTSFEARPDISAQNQEYWQREETVCHSWIPEPGMRESHGKLWPAGHVCRQPATKYIRIGRVVEHVCSECYRRDITRGAQPATAAEYVEWMESEDDD